MDETETTVASALWRGACCKCPKCGEGQLFRAFLKVSDSCNVCGQELHHHRADDLPAYIVISIVGHVVVGLLLSVEISYAPPLWVHMALWIPLTLILSLGLLQPVKGAIVGLQWRLGMHGFGMSKHGGNPDLHEGAASA
jgi:uncharacterized protein (DUF983 family)